MTAEARPALALILSVVCPHCQFSGTPLPYEQRPTVTCEDCGASFTVAPDMLRDGQHALLVALGDAEPVPGRA